MKNFKKSILVFMAVMAISLTSCKKDDDGGDGGSAGHGAVVAKIGGSNFKSLEVASVASQSTGSTGTSITVQGSDASGKAIFLYIVHYDGPGTYEIKDSDVFVSATYVEANISNPTATKTWTAPYEGSGMVGEIKVSEKSETNIKGTFKFMAKNVNDDGSIKNITDGSFNVDFR